MPVFWNKVSKTVQKNGFEITRILDGNNSFGFWLPDIRFHDAAELDYLVEVSRSVVFEVSL